MNIALFILTTWAQSGAIGPHNAIEDLIEKIARSGRIVEAMPAAERLRDSSKEVAPGAPPLLAFRYFDGADRHRFGKLDLMVDDGGIEIAGLAMAPRGPTLLLLIASCAFAQSDPLTLGLEAFARGDYPTAERELRKAPTNPQAKAFLAMTLAATNRCSEALPELKQAFESAPSTTRRLAGLSLAQCHLTASKFDDAAVVIAGLKQLAPTDPDVLYLSARLHMRAWNEALHDLYKSAPGSYRVNQISGEILETQGQYAAAAAEYKKAIEKNPDALSLHFRLGRALLMSTHSSETYEEVTKEFEAEVARNPRDAVAHYQIGQILLVQDKTPEAAARLEQALAIDPDFAEALIALGKLRVSEKRSDDAIHLLTRAAELQPKNETAHYNLMLAYRNAGRLDDARREKSILDAIQKPPEGEFTDFLKKLGEKPAPAK